ncbi:hypothetical protein LCGC14_1756690 [marine sediment metagenome]|uniref:Uncharacterized protein n=1 Tax=marine sediment metagenome TaxID=412755 RepID=A0A0F9JHD2_9ZZZZ
MSIRKFTFYLRDHGVELIEILFNQREITFEEFYKWFDVYDVSEEQKKISVERILERLINDNLIIKLLKK